MDANKLIELSQDLICTTNFKGRFTEINSACFKVFGYTQAELIGKEFIELVHPDNIEKAKKEFDNLLETEKIKSFEIKCIHKNGSTKYLSWKTTTAQHEKLIYAIGYDITDQKLTKDALKVTEETFKNLANNAQVAISILNPSLENSILYANKYWQNITEYSREEFMNLGALNIVYPDDRAIVLDRAKKRISGKKAPDHYEIRLLTKTGKIKWVDLGATKIEYEGSLASLTTATDITKRKKIEQTLLAEKLFSESLINKLPGVFYLISQEGKILRWNKPLEMVTGRSAEEIATISPMDLFEGEDKKSIAESIAKVFKQGQYNVRGRLVAKSGKKIPYQFNGHKIIVDGSPCLIGLGLDYTVQNQTENELVKAKEKAEESDILKTAFLTNMSHEIRTPLNAVLGFSELLARKDLADDEKENFAEYIRLNGESLAKIIDDIIDISKLQSKQLTIKKESFNLQTLFNELHNYYSCLLIQKSKTQIKLILDIPEIIKSNYYIKSDEQRLKQILNNLISNAIKYSEKGQITFGCCIEDNKLHFFVKDTGYGIAPENIDQVFDRFIQFSPAYVSKQEGTGLGLSICKNLVNLLGGKLQVKSKVDQGSTFYFNIPFVRCERNKSVNETLTKQTKRDLSKHLILIADDEDSNYVLTKRILKPTKVTTDWAQNGKHAVEMAKNTNYDLILMDIKMPEMDGIEATRLIKKHNKNIPIVMQTAFAMKEVKDEAIDAGCDGFIVKPIALNAFLELVNKHIKIK